MDAMPQDAQDWSRPVVRAAAVCLIVGLGWRMVRYLLHFPIWGDEAFVLIDIHERGYLGLTQTLTFWQVAPLLFLWGEKLVLSLCGTSELAVHLLPFLASTVALLLFTFVARRWLNPAHGALAVAVLAVSYYPVRHGCEAKPYAFDLLMSVMLLVGAVGWLYDSRRVGWLVFLTLWVPIALCASYPAVFVAGGVSLAMLPRMRQASWAARSWYIAFNIAIVAGFLGHYLTVGRNQAGGPHAGRTDQFLHNYWREAFPPHSFGELPLWLLQTHTGGLLAYPVGGAYGSSTASLVLCIVGARYLWKTGRRSLLLVCVMPFALSLLAAFMERYPYGGSARIAQHLAPMACLLIGAGGVWLLEWLRSPIMRSRWGCIACAVLAVLGVIGAARDWHRPYKTQYDRTTRDLVGAFLARVQPGESVVICNIPSEVNANYHWYLCRDADAVAWLGNERIAPDAPGVWLLHFGIYPPAPGDLQALQPNRGQGWSIAEHEQVALPTEAPGDVIVTWTRVHLVRASPLQ
jgi:4-amino-4-deoxy-L-arabinose transferase-like glycosyltransferase